MARRKNTKRIDPRYFLHETVDRKDDVNEAVGTIGPGGGGVPRREDKKEELDEGCPMEDEGEAIDLSAPGVELHVDDIGDLPPEEELNARLAGLRENDPDRAAKIQDMPKNPNPPADRKKPSKAQLGREKQEDAEASELYKQDPGSFKEAYQNDENALERMVREEIEESLIRSRLRHMVMEAIKEVRAARIRKE